MISLEDTHFGIVGAMKIIPPKKWKRNFKYQNLKEISSHFPSKIFSIQKLEEGVFRIMKIEPCGVKTLDTIEKTEAQFWESLQKGSFIHT